MQGLLIHRVGDYLGVIEGQVHGRRFKHLDFRGIRGGLHPTVRNVGQESNADVVASGVAVGFGVDADESV